jgi:hypothetical protein
MTCFEIYIGVRYINGFFGNGNTYNINILNILLFEEDLLSLITLVEYFLSLGE